MFYSLEKAAALTDGYQKAFSINGEKILLCQVDGQLFAIENQCPHMDVPLDRATLLAGAKIRCNAHGIEFELESGKACGPLAGTLCNLKKYPVDIINGEVGVNV